MPSPHNTMYSDIALSEHSTPTSTVEGELLELAERGKAGAIGGEVAASASFACVANIFVDITQAPPPLPTPRRSQRQNIGIPAPKFIPSRNS